MHIKEIMKAYLNKRTCFKACRNLGARLMLKEKMILSFCCRINRHCGADRRPPLLYDRIQNP